jgi:hypothetical protein
MQTPHRHLIPSLAATLLALSGLVQACAKPEPITQEQFSTLRWLDGRWFGSGGAYPAFYEEYQVIDDSTIVQRNFPDSTFTNASDSAFIELRGGAGQKGDPGTIQYRIAHVRGDTVRFEPAREGRSGFTWIRLSDSAWRAVLDGSPNPTVYEMRRISPPPAP